MIDIYRKYDYDTELTIDFLFQVFGSDRIRAFGMAKFLSSHLQG